MHPRNIYNVKPDFKEMAVKFPNFRKFVKQDLAGKVTINFKDKATLRELSKTLLKKDFNLEVEIPLNRLIPTIPLRLNYILWLEDMVEAMKPSPNSVIHGIDVGTGAACVYPLLAAKRIGWHMTATDNDEETLKIATENVNRNDLQGLISVIPGDRTFLEHIVDGSRTYDFCMCNPPFFATVEDMNPIERSRNKKRLPPKNAFSGQINEIIAEGGEVGFVKKMIDESTKLKGKIRLYSTMIGRKVSLRPLKNYLESLNITKYTITEFHQGNTTRWGLAWSYEEIKCFKKKHHKGAGKKKMFAHFPRAVLTLPEKYNDITIEELVDKIKELLTILQIDYYIFLWTDVSITFCLTIKKNTWTGLRQKRRQEKRALAAATQSSSMGSSDDSMISNQSSSKEESSNNGNNTSENLENGNQPAGSSHSTAITEESEPSVSGIKRPIEDRDEDCAKKRKLTDFEQEPYQIHLVAQKCSDTSQKELLFLLLSKDADGYCKMMLNGLKTYFKNNIK